MTTRWPTSAIRYDETYEPMPFKQIDADDRPGDEREALLIGEHVVEDRLDERGQARRSDGVDEHADDGPGEPAAIRRRVAEQTLQRMRHSVNRYFNSVQTATTPSFQVIFFPSS